MLARQLILIMALVISTLSKSHQDPVVFLDGEFFNQTGIGFVGEDLRALKGEWFIMFMVPWCQHCKDAMPVWLRFGQLVLNYETNIGIVNCDKNAQACRLFMIDGYPTSLYFTKQKVYKFYDDLIEEKLKHFLDEGYKSSQVVPIKPMSLKNMALMFVHRVGIMTILAGILIVTWLSYLCSGMFLKSVEKFNQQKRQQNLQNQRLKEQKQQ